LTPVDFEEATHRFAAPADWNEQENGPCATLAVMQIEDDGGKRLLSAWRPTIRDIDNLRKGGFVILEVFGSGHPAVSVRTCERAAIKPK
jgi:hypothetical protein